jgi:microcystin-dependent protein
MSEPITANRNLIAPQTGDLPGSWGTACLNPNWQMIDAMFGGVTSISLSGATTILLTVPATTGIWGGTVPQSSNSMITLMGAQTGPAVLQFQLPGFYIINNQCTGTTYVQLSPSTGGGNSIGVPQGKKSHVFFDGTSMDFVDPPEPGVAIDLHGWTALPPWMTACSVLPYLIKDGSVYSASAYPALFAALGSTFGGNGITAFGVPDERARMRIGLDTVQGGATSARVTFGVAGITGSLMGAVGGSQAMQTHTHGITDPGHLHTPNLFEVGQYGAGGVTAAQSGSYNGEITINSSTTNITINAVGSGSSQNMPPSIVSHLPLIKT